MKLIKHIANIAIILVLTATTALQAQNIPAASPDSGIMKIMALFSVNRVKAQQIKAALTYHREQLNNVLNDPKVKKEAKQTFAAKIIKERKLRLDSLLSPKQQKIWEEKQQENKVKINTLMERIHQKHMENEDKVPHKRSTYNTIIKDSLAKKKN